MKKVIVSFLIVLLSVGIVGCAKSSDKKGDSTASVSQKKDSKQEDTKAVDVEKKSKFPDFNGVDLNGNKYDNSIFEKNDVTVINFWSKDCPPCVEEMPELEKMSKEWKSKGINLIAIPTVIGEGEAMDETNKLIKNKGITFPNIYLDEKSGNEILTQLLYTPTTIVVNKKGEIVGDIIPSAITSEKAMNILEENIKLALDSNK